MKVIRYTIFESNAFGNGAEKRTAQITELLKNAGIETLFIVKRKRNGLSILNVLTGIPVLIKLRKIIPVSQMKGLKGILRQIRNYLLAYEELAPVLKTDIKIFLWECTRSENFFVPLIAKQFGKRIIGLPHNLESLVPNQISTVSLKKAPHWFNEEINYLSHCDEVFCISKEETLFLKLFNISANYLPYYPTKEVESFFLNIRRERLKSNRRGIPTNILMLGSANNQPTRIGMLNRIEFFKKNINIPVKLTIAGFASETLAEPKELPSNICILGTLTCSQLEEELIKTDAIIIHQQASTGALTRISEMLIAGIPIILNFESARDYYNSQGLYIYDNDKRFQYFLKLELSFSSFMDKCEHEELNLIENITNDE